MAGVQILDLLELVASKVSIPVYWHDINGMLLGSNHAFRQVIAEQNQADCSVQRNFEIFRAEKLLIQNGISTENIARLSPFFSMADAALYQTDGSIVAIVGTLINKTYESRHTASNRIAKNTVTKTYHINKDSMPYENQNTYATAGRIVSDTLNKLLTRSDYQENSSPTYKQCNELFKVLNDIFNKIEAVDACVHKINPLLPINTEKETHKSTYRFNDSLCSDTGALLAANTQLSFLLVEDNPVVLNILEALISRKGHKSIAVIDGETALSLVKSNHFDMIITDVGLPGISGIELTIEIRAWEKKYTQERQVIIGLTGHEQAETHSACLNSGMNKVFTKPANTATIDTMIDYAYKEKKLKHFANSQINTLNIGLGDTASSKELLNIDSHSIFDPHYALAQLNDMGLLSTLVTAYLSDEIQNDIKRMIDAYKDRNWQQIGAIAHKLKGGALCIRTARLYYALQHLEQYHKTGDYLLLDSLYNQALNINAQTIKVLSSWLKQHNKGT